MKEIIAKYLKNDFGEIEMPTNEKDKMKLVRALLGLSLINRIDYWLDYSKDFLDNALPKEPFIRENELSLKDKSFRDTFSKLDNETKTKVGELINSTVTGVVFSILTNLDQFDFGDISIFLKPKSDDNTQIKITSDLDDLHDELSEWIYTFSKFREVLVVKEEDKYGTSYRLK